MYAGDLFEMEFHKNWEYNATQELEETLTLFTNEYRKITQAQDHDYQQKEFNSTMPLLDTNSNCGQTPQAGMDKSVSMIEEILEYSTALDNMS